MRRLMLTIALVLVAAVVDVKAQGHGAHAAPPAKAPATPAAPAPAVKEPAAKEPAHETAPDVATVLERISKHVAEVTEISTPRPAAHSAPADQPKKSPARPAASHARAATTQPVAARARVELDWHTPLLVWPEELLRPDAPASR